MKVTAIRTYRGKEHRTDYHNVTYVEPCIYTNIDGRKTGATRLHFADHPSILLMSPVKVEVYA